MLPVTFITFLGLNMILLEMEMYMTRRLVSYIFWQTQYVIHLCKIVCSDRMIADAFSAIATMVDHGFPVTCVGKILPSTILRFLVPSTRKRLSTTVRGSSFWPILHVPTGWCALLQFCRSHISRSRSDLTSLPGSVSHPR